MNFFRQISNTGNDDQQKTFSYSIEDIPDSFPPAFHVEITSGKSKNKRVVFYEMPQELAYFYNLNNTKEF